MQEILEDAEYLVLPLQSPARHSISLHPAQVPSTC
jgi:hypothetical protein